LQSFGRIANLRKEPLSKFGGESMKKKSNRLFIAARSVKALVEDNSSAQNPQAR
jgi:hypothetical protein